MQTKIVYKKKSNTPLNIYNTNVYYLNKRESSEGKSFYFSVYSNVMAFSFSDFRIQFFKHNFILNVGLLKVL